MGLLQQLQLNFHIAPLFEPDTTACQRSVLGSRVEVDLQQTL